MGRRRHGSRGVSTSARGIPWARLFDWKSGNLGAMMLAITYLVLPWLTTGIFDATTTIFGIMFLTMAVMRAKPNNSVFGGLFQAFIAVGYLFAVAGVMNTSILWILTILLAIGFFIFELGFVKWGPTTSKADAFQIVPLTILAFSIVTTLAGYNQLYTIDFNRIFSALNYIGLMLFCFVSAFQLSGWSVTGNEAGTNKLILVLALMTVASAILGIYQGTLFAWR